MHFREGADYINVGFANRQEGRIRLSPAFQPRGTVEKAAQLITTRGDAGAEVGPQRRTGHREPAASRAIQDDTGALVRPGKYGITR